MYDFYDYVQIDPDSLKKVVNGKFVGNVSDGGSVQYSSKKKSLTVKIAATHSGRLTKKSILYQPKYVKDGTQTFISPVKRPVLIGHDWDGEAIGRIQNAEYISLDYDFLSGDPANLPESQSIEIYRHLARSGLLFNDSFQGLGYVQLTTKIQDKQAIEKFLDERYLTFSVGGGTPGYKCSLCDFESSKDCGHYPGRMYDNEKCYMVAGPMRYYEVSVVNIPADEAAIAQSVEFEDKATPEDLANIVTFTPPGIYVVKDTFITFEEEDSMAKPTGTTIETDSWKIPEIKITDRLENPSEINETLDLIVEKMIVDGEAPEGSVLDAEQKLKLDSRLFAGPNRSFPVNDCLYVEASRRLIDKAKISDATKKKIVAGLNRRANTLKCSRSEDSAHLWMHDSASEILKELSDFDISGFADKVFEEIQDRGIDECKYQEELAEANKKIQELEKARDSQTKELEQTHQVADEAISVARQGYGVALNLATVVSGQGKIKSLEGLFIIEEDKTLDEMQQAVQELENHQGFKDNVQSLFKGVAPKTNDDDPEAQIEDQLPSEAEHSVIKEEELKRKNEQIIRDRYTELLKKQGYAIATGYLQQMVSSKMVAGDFNPTSDK